jgi:hypothetical protein
MLQTHASIPPILAGCEHNGASNAVFSPIAWPFVDGAGPAIRTAELASGVFRNLYLVLPSRSHTGIGRIVVTSYGTGLSGAITLPVYQIVRFARPQIDQATGLMNIPTGAVGSLSAAYADSHALNGSDWLTTLMTPIDTNPNMDPAGDPGQFFSSLYLHVLAPYGVVGAPRGMIINGLAVQDW